MGSASVMVNREPRRGSLPAAADTHSSQAAPRSHTDLHQPGVNHLLPCSMLPSITWFLPQNGLWIRDEDGHTDTSGVPGWLHTGGLRTDLMHKIFSGKMPSPARRSLWDEQAAVGRRAITRSKRSWCLGTPGTLAEPEPAGITGMQFKAGCPPVTRDCGPVPTSFTQQNQFSFTGPVEHTI